ncbi:hypothetical protein [Thiobaca trueperi]|uniref:Uncharacterized protein n=1 Tax=Thiobaca trueperi TaxID=127458 RepID=A0A4R3MY24_9GAMM|nr:hypothetical protein [Thiobaca trueperi]TCT21550.1 hypothetical protein EDC35_104410 [Thiobaca trueperi]
MKLFKLLNEKFYKEGASFNTSDVNYSRSIGDPFEREEFYDYLFDATDRNDVGIDLYAVMANFINLPGGGAVCLDLLSSGSDIALASVMPGDSHYANRIMKREEFLEACRLIERLDIKFETGSDATRLWEYLFEKVRREKFDNLPSRLMSYFAFKSESDIAHYRKEHGMRGVSCVIDASNCTQAVELDMALFDAVGNNFTYSMAKTVAERYWSGGSSDDPVIEVLLQGEIILAERIQ